MFTIIRKSYRKFFKHKAKGFLTFAGGIEMVD